jgi:L-lactate dehydrogenase complex protein LldF
LRQVFLQADVGISGVNFGVAENGILCLLTNEGNGRMVTTIPPVHIALMGIERLVPTLDDLALMLYLLPRSATGQKLTVYASLMRAPSVNGDGPRERHLVLVDNGRTKIRNSPLAEVLYCIRCGACFNACPVFREIGGHAYVSRSGKNTPYAGPIGSVLSPALFGGNEYAHLARASSLCGACREACPVDIDLPKLLLRVRAGKMPQTIPAKPAKPNAPGYLTWGLKVFTWIATSPTRFYLAQWLAGFLSRALSPFSPWMRLPTFSGWGYSKDFPRPSTRPFRARWRSIYAPEGSRTSTESKPTASIQSSTPPVPSADETASLVERFAQELQTLGGVFDLCDASSLGQRVLNLLRANHINAIQAWQAEYLPAGLLDFLKANGIHVTDQPNPELKAGLTGALCAIAESGTLVLPGGNGRPLTASLLPEMHIAILRAEDICESLPQGLHRQEEHKAAATILISGPSRTADIEMTLTIGVHGPRQVHVFCLRS